MSWFDSSFSFARTALNQAQKSIDKVLDIKENEVQPDINGKCTMLMFAEAVLHTVGL